MCSPLKANGHLQLQGLMIGIVKLNTCVVLVYCLPYSSTVKMEVMYSTETLVDCQRSIWRYILEARTLHKISHFLSLSLPFGVTAHIWALAYLDETFRFTSVY
jgi:hypothetical protein